MKSLFFVVLLSFLTACGGGGGGSSSPAQPTTSAVALSVLSNAQGIARITSPTSVGLVYSPEIAALVQGMNTPSQGSSSTIADISPTNYPVISTTATTETRRGTLTLGGTTINVTALKNNLTTNAAGAYLEIPGDADILLVLGHPATSIPTSGTSTYTGVFTNNSRAVIAPGELGTFSLVIDFAGRTFTVTASTATSSLSGSGTVDVSAGLFASTNVLFTKNSQAYTSNLYGNLNGSGASSITAIFFTSDSTPDYAGSMIGSK